MSDWFSGQDAARSGGNMPDGGEAFRGYSYEMNRQRQERDAQEAASRARQTPSFGVQHTGDTWSHSYQGSATRLTRTGPTIRHYGFIEGLIAIPLWLWLLINATALVVMIIMGFTQPQGWQDPNLIRYTTYAAVSLIATIVVLAGLRKQRSRIIRGAILLALAVGLFVWIDRVAAHSARFGVSEAAGFTTTGERVRYAMLYVIDSEARKSDTGNGVKYVGVLGVCLLLGAAGAIKIARGIVVKMSGG